MRFLAVLLCASASFAADLPDGTGLLNRSIEKMGGEAAFAKIKALTMTGKVDFVGHNLGGPVSIYQQGDKSYTVIEFPGLGKVEEGYDGKVAWEMNALQGPRIKEGDEKVAATRMSRMNSLSSWKELYKEARTVGEETIGGKLAWKVEMIPVEGKPETFFFDKESVLLVRTSQVVATALGDIPAEADLGDYRAVDGVLAPFSMTEKAMNQTIAMHFEKIVWNPEIPPDRFDLPPAVKALAEKGKR